MIIASVMEVLAVPDITPPVVSSVTFSSTTFCYDANKQSLSPPSFTATINVKDASGISGVTISLENDDMSSACSGLIFYFSQNWVGGSYTVGTYQATCTLLVKTNTWSNPVGKYYTHLEASDWTSNSMDMNSSAIAAAGFPSFIEYSMC